MKMNKGEKEKTQRLLSHTHASTNTTVPGFERAEQLVLGAEGDLEHEIKSSTQTYTHFREQWEWMD